MRVLDSTRLCAVATAPLGPQIAHHDYYAISDLEQALMQFIELAAL
jgi:hypothetical protein